MILANARANSPRKRGDFETRVQRPNGFVNKYLGFTDRIAQTQSERIVRMAVVFSRCQLRCRQS